MKSEPHIIGFDLASGSDKTVPFLVKDGQVFISSALLSAATIGTGRRRYLEWRRNPYALALHGERLSLDACWCNEEPDNTRSSRIKHLLKLKRYALWSMGPRLRP